MSVFSLQRLCAALHYGVGKLSSEVGREAGVAFDKTVVASLANAAFEKVSYLDLLYWPGMSVGNEYFGTYGVANSNPWCFRL